MSNIGININADDKIVKNPKGCACAKTCCNNAIIFTPEHVCPTKKFCEECYKSECENCHSSCYCEL